MTYTPKKGDIVVIDLNPQSGHEQMGRRPALVVSNNVLNTRSNVIFFAPITHTIRAFPTHVSLNNQTNTTGSILCEQTKALDYKARHARFVEKAPVSIIEEVTDIMLAIFE
ncbi:type II toxin-antitoxin system PemK/MazF family toxin [Sporolactobacillus sp. THM7-7]|nr:type II toxin-antitoxin system PemK/MazF family toxin [Sporolactobacillus sp. THM7-7]